MSSLREQVGIERHFLSNSKFKCLFKKSLKSEMSGWVGQKSDTKCHVLFECPLTFFKNKVRENSVELKRNALNFRTCDSDPHAWEPALHFRYVASLVACVQHCMFHN